MEYLNFFINSGNSGSSSSSSSNSNNKNEIFSNKSNVNKTQVINLIEESSSISLLSFGKSISFDSFMDSFEKINPDLPLQINLKTYGGKVSTFLPIAQVLSLYPSKVTVKIDRYAYSGGTLLCLVADEIQMTEFTQLGAINPYILLPITTRQIKTVQEKYNNSNGTSTSTSTSALTDLLFEYANDMEKSYLYQMTIMLARKKYTKEQVDEILNFFLYKFDHNIPIYYNDLLDIIKNKVTIQPFFKPQTASSDTPESNKSNNMNETISSFLMQ